MYALALGAVTAGAVVTPNRAVAQNVTDTIKVDTFERSIPPEGTTDSTVLAHAPSPQITVKGDTLNARIVVDIQNNTLYKYDKDGNPEKAYLIATGGQYTRTKPGLRRVSHIEHFPYKYAPAGSKRRRNPKAYGKHILILDIVDEKTGELSRIGQFIHGNKDEDSIGKKCSLGCMRMNNKVMNEEMSKEIKKGDFVLLINPDPDWQMKKKKR